MNIQCLSSHNTCRFAAKELTALLADGHLQEAQTLFLQEFEPLVQQHELLDQSGLDVYRSLLILGRTFRIRS